MLGYIPFQEIHLKPSPVVVYGLWYPLTFAWCGVALFFVVSGFVIHWSFLKARQFDIRTFYWRRFWRIYPAYFVALMFFTWYNQVPLSTAKGMLQLFSHIFLIHNFNSSSFFGIVGVFWSLAVECQLYLAYPLILKMRDRFGGDVRGVRKALLVTLGVSLVYRFCMTSVFKWSDPGLNQTVWLSPIALWFDWTLGVYIAECFHQGKRAFKLQPLVVAIIFLVFFASTWTKFTSIFTYSLAAMLGAIWIDSYVHKITCLSTLERLCVPIGLYSYSFYLWHHPLIRLVLNGLHSMGLPDSLWVTWTAGLAISFGALLLLAFVLYHSIEKRGVDFGRALMARRRS